MNKIEVAESLISLGCFQISPSEPFTYGSGLLGPVYCDNRRLISYPTVRKKVADAMAQKIREWGGEYDSLAGIATGGIPYSALVAERLECPLLYVRSGAKGYGKNRQVEGNWDSGDRVVLIEDLVNQGEALGKAVEAVREVDLSPMACFCIVNYQMEASAKICREEEVGLFPLTDLDSLIEAYGRKWEMTSDEKKSVESWRQDPKNWFDQGK